MNNVKSVLRKAVPKNHRLSRQKSRRHYMPNADFFNKYYFYKPLIKLLFKTSFKKV